MTYLVVLDSDSRTLTTDSVVAAASARWPDARPAVDLTTVDRSRVVEWTATTAANEDVEVAVNEGLTSFAVDGSVRACAEVVAWVRQVVEQDVSLTVCDDGFGFDFTLEVGATPQWVEQRLDDLADQDDQPSS